MKAHDIFDSGTARESHPGELHSKRDDSVGSRHTWGILPAPCLKNV